MDSTEKLAKQVEEKINIEVTKKVEEIKEEFECNPWSTSGKIDYLRLVKQFGTELIDQELIEKFQRITKKDIHPWLRRGIFFSHRGLNQFLDAFENGEPVFLYTGRGPTSDAMHIGHLIPFMFTQWLQEVFDCPLIIQISDEEKAAFKRDKFDKFYRMGFENAKEIIACGFNPKKTFIFSNRDYRNNIKQYENFASEMKMIVPLKDLQKVFGLNEDSSIAMYDWPFYQTAAAFYQAYPHIFGGRPAYCLVPYAIDQDPYFRLARDIAYKMNLIKPCSIMCTFIPPLTGLTGKMSSSVGTDATLFLTDDYETLKEKVSKHAYSGGGGNGTLEDHRKFGGNTDVDIAYQYLRYFEEDDQVLKETQETFKSGQLSCGEIKLQLVKKLSQVMEKVKANRQKVTQEILEDFYELKPMELPKPKEKEKTEQEAKLYDVLKSLNIEYRTKYHSIVVTKEDSEDLQRSLEGTLCKALFLKAQGDNYYLYIINANTNVNMKTLHKRVGVSKISFGQAEYQTELLKVPRNSGTILSLFNDTDKKVQSILIDEDILKDKHVNVPAMRPDATITLSFTNMIKFIETYKYPIKYIKE